MSNSEKMDQDREQIAELKARTEVSESLVVQLQQALNQAHTELAEVTKSSADGLQQSSKEILVLKQKLASCIAALDSKDIELSNLQSALGQYYAESEAQV
jgi:capsule polysaccharide export protein KpsE/RkpR